jgi:hypothetical protein
MLKKLTIAIEQNNYSEFTKVLDRLLEDNYFQVNALDEHGETLLGIAVERGRLDMVHLLLDRGAAPNSADYALHQAVENENMQIIDLLLDRGADIDRIDNFGRTPILLAANYGFEKIAIHLIKHGANIEIANCLELKPIHYALAWHLTDTVSLLETSPLCLIEERLFLESIYQSKIDKVCANLKPIEIKQYIYNSRIPLIDLIKFFALSSSQQLAVIPHLSEITKFDFRDGDVVTDSALDILGCGYEQSLGNLTYLLEEDPKYTGFIFTVICLAASDIRTLIYRTCDTSIGDNYFEDNALESDLFSLIRYLSRLICSYLDIEISISTYDLRKLMDYYLHP